MELISCSEGVSAVTLLVLSFVHLLGCLPEVFEWRNRGFLCFSFFNVKSLGGSVVFIEVHHSVIALHVHIVRELCFLFLPKIHGLCIIIQLLVSLAELACRELACLHHSLVHPPLLLFFEVIGELEYLEHNVIDEELDEHLVVDHLLPDLVRKEDVLTEHSLQ